MNNEIDKRIGDYISQSTSSPHLVLVGFCSDEGVTRNGGRAGAAKAPQEIRKQLYKLTPDVYVHDAFVNIINHTLDLGDIKIEDGSMESQQQKLAETIAPYIVEGARVVILGGGHETSFGHFCGYVQAKLPVRIMNWDAHCDVRPYKNGKAHSGSPFRQALEHDSGLCLGYSVAGVQPHSASKSHVQYIIEKGGRVYFNRETDRQRIRDQYRYRHDRTFATFDMDAIDETAAPGVSAPAANGLNKDQWLYAAYMAGYHDHVSSIDIVETNPDFDIDNRTSRLAALTVWNFIKGWADKNRNLPALL